MEIGPLPPSFLHRPVASTPVDSRSFPAAAANKKARKRPDFDPKLNTATSPQGMPSPYALKPRPAGLPAIILEQSNHGDSSWDVQVSKLPDWGVASPQDVIPVLNSAADEEDPEMVDGASLYEFHNYGMGKRNVLGRSVGTLKGRFDTDQRAVPDISAFDHFVNALQAEPADDASLEGVGVRLKVKNTVAVAVTSKLLKILPGTLSEPPMFTSEEEKAYNMQYKSLKQLVDAKPHDIALTDWLEPSELELWWQLMGKSVGEVTSPQA